MKKMFCLAALSCAMLLGMKANWLRVYAAPGVIALVGIGVQLSGYTNLPLGIALIILGLVWAVVAYLDKIPDSLDFFGGSRLKRAEREADRICADPHLLAFFNELTSTKNNLPRKTIRWIVGKKNRLSPIGNPTLEDEREKRSARFFLKRDYLKMITDQADPRGTTFFPSEWAFEIKRLIQSKRPNLLS